jgi:hypothetical protein
LGLDPEKLNGGLIFNRLGGPVFLKPSCRSAERLSHINHAATLSLSKETKITLTSSDPSSDADLPLG